MSPEEALEILVTTARQGVEATGGLRSGDDFPEDEVLDKAERIIRGCLPPEAAWLISPRQLDNFHTAKVRGLR